MRKLVLVIFIFIISFQLRAQRDATLLTQLPFEKFLSGIVIIKAQLAPYKDSLNFILDTGSGGISLDSTTCVKLGIESRMTDTFASGVGGKRKVRFTFNRTLALGGYNVDSLNFHLNDYSLLTALYNIKIDGIIGYSFLKRYIVMIDYDEVMVKVYSKGKFNYPPRGSVFKNPITSIPFENVSISDARKIDGNFYFDSGAGLELLFSKQFVADSNVFLPKRKPLVASVEGVMGREDMSIAVVKSFSLVPYEFKPVPGFIFADSNNVLKYPRQLGLIGSGILSRFNVILNFPENEIFLKPNQSFNDPFDYSYSGLNIWDNKGRIEVYDVIPNSPADKAGFIVGDEIVGIEKVFSGNLQTYRKMLKSEKTTLSIVIKREKDYKPMLLKVSSIL
jgi:hypothetical protein